MTAQYQKLWINKGSIVIPKKYRIYYTGLKNLNNRSDEVKIYCAFGGITIFLIFHRFISSLWEIFLMLEDEHDVTLRYSDGYTPMSKDQVIKYEDYRILIDKYREILGLHYKKFWKFIDHIFVSEKDLTLKGEYLIPFKIRNAIGITNKFAHSFFYDDYIEIWGEKYFSIIEEYFKKYPSHDQIIRKNSIEEIATKQGIKIDTNSIDSYFIIKYYLNEWIDIINNFDERTRIRGLDITNLK